MAHLVLTHEYGNEDPATSILDPDGDPFPDMKGITVSEEGVIKLLQKTNPRKASGPDMIPARLLKECADKLAPFLKTFQKCNPPDFKFYPSKLTDKIFPHMV